MRTTLHNLIRHLAPNGVLVVEPWIEPAKFLPHHVHLLTVERPELKIARLTVSRRSRDRSIMDMHYLVGTPEHARYIHERHTLTMVPKTRIRSWLVSEGLSVRVLAVGFSGRGLIVARRRAALSA